MISVPKRRRTDGGDEKARSLAPAPAICHLHNLTGVLIGVMTSFLNLYDLTTLVCVSRTTKRLVQTNAHVSHVDLRLRARALFVDPSDDLPHAYERLTRPLAIPSLMQLMRWLRFGKPRDGTQGHEAKSPRGKPGQTLLVDGDFVHRYSQVGELRNSNIHTLLIEAGGTVTTAQRIVDSPLWHKLPTLKLENLTLVDVDVGSKPPAAFGWSEYLEWPNQPRLPRIRTLQKFVMVGGRLDDNCVANMPNTWRKLRSLALFDVNISQASLKIMCSLPLRDIVLVGGCITNDCLALLDKMAGQRLESVVLCNWGSWPRREHLAKYPALDAICRLEIQDRDLWPYTRHKPTPARLLHSALVEEQAALASGSVTSRNC